MSAFVLAIDQGTTGTTVALVDESGQLRAKVNHEFPQVYPKPGWVEHRPAEIWQSVLHGIRDVLAQAQARELCRPADIAAIGIANQRETALLWERGSGEPLFNAIVWQCRRTTEFCAALKRRGLEPRIRRKTGLLLDPYFSASKYRWLLRNVPGARAQARRGKALGGTVDSYLVWKLTGGEQHVTDAANASRTSLMNLRALDWDGELLDMFEVPLSLLPRIVPNSGALGHTRKVPGLPDGIPIAGMAGDQQAALFGQACFSPGDAKCTYGTGSFILMNTGKQLARSKSGLLSTVAWQLPGAAKVNAKAKANAAQTGRIMEPLPQAAKAKANAAAPAAAPTYALEGGAFICGAAVQWLRDELQIIREAAEVEALAAAAPDSGGVVFVPALAGLGAPWWEPGARGAITGLTRGAGRAHIARATLDAMAMQNVDILLAMEKDLGKRMKPLRVDGGACRNNLLMQIQADVLGRKLIRPALTETTVAGASYLAGLGIGLWPDLKSIRAIWRTEREFAPAIPPKQRQSRLRSWRKAVGSAVQAANG